MVIKLTPREFIELWRETSPAEMSNTELLYREINSKCDTLLKVEQAGLSMRWEKLPEGYREKALILLCIKLSGGSLETALEKAMNR